MAPIRSGALDDDRQLDIMLRPDQELTSMLGLCRLASRLGVRVVWVHRRQVLADDALPALRAAAGPSSVGVVLDAGESVDAGLLESAEPTETFVAVCGGAGPYGERAYAPRLDTSAAGYVVRGVDRREAARLCREARKSIDSDGARTRIVVDVPVVFGRTFGEAEARLRLDGWLRSTTDPETTGLFGTFADAQEQAHALFDAGAHVLRATLATEADDADLLAQLRAVVASPLRSLLPQALISQDR
jgi:hypothetical protein